MVHFSNYLQNKLLGHTLLGSTYTAPTAPVYLSLATSVASDGDTFQEVPTGTGYGRQAIAFGAPVSTQLVRNSGTITFTPASTPWGTITHIGIYDASTSGNLLYWGPLASSRAVSTGEVFQTPANSITVQLD